MFKYAVKFQFLTMMDCMLPICNIFCFILFIYTLRAEATFSLCELAYEKQPLPTTVQFSIVHARNSKLFRYFDKIMVNVKAFFTIIVKFQGGTKGLFNNSILVFTQKIQYVMKDVFVNTVEPRYFELIVLSLHLESTPLFRTCQKQSTNIRAQLETYCILFKFLIRN